MADLVDQTEDVIRTYVLGELPKDDAAALDAMPLKNLLIVYGDWRARLIPAGRRQVHRSSELAQSAKAAEHQADLDALVAEIEAGHDLTPHLSKQVVNVSAVDRMLAQWGIHHLHLSSELEPAGKFTKRGGDLLFGIFRVDDAYLLGIYPHGAWALREFVEVAVHSWPDAGLFLESRYIVGVTQTWTDDERAQLQRAGISTGLIEVDGRFWSPAAIGQTFTGGSIHVVGRVNDLMFRLWDLRENLPERLAMYEQTADEAAGRPLGGDWTPIVYEGTCGLLREDVFVPIGAVA